MCSLEQRAGRASLSHMVEQRREKMLNWNGKQLGCQAGCPRARQTKGWRCISRLDQAVCSNTCCLDILDSETTAAHSSRWTLTTEYSVLLRYGQRAYHFVRWSPRFLLSVVEGRREFRSGISNLDLCGDGDGGLSCYSRYKTILFVLNTDLGVRAADGADAGELAR